MSDDNVGVNSKSTNAKEASQDDADKKHSAPSSLDQQASDHATGTRNRQITSGQPQCDVSSENDTVKVKHQGCNNKVPDINKAVTRNTGNEVGSSEISKAKESTSVKRSQVPVNKFHSFKLKHNNYYNKTLTNELFNQQELFENENEIEQNSNDVPQQLSTESIIDIDSHLVNGENEESITYLQEDKSTSGIADFSTIDSVSLSEKFADSQRFVSDTFAISNLCRSVNSSFDKMRNDLLVMVTPSSYLSHKNTKEQLNPTKQDKTPKLSFLIPTSSSFSKTTNVSSTTTCCLFDFEHYETTSTTVEDKRNGDSLYNLDSSTDATANHGLVNDTDASIDLCISSDALSISDPNLNCNHIDSPIISHTTANRCKENDSLTDNTDVPVSSNNMTNHLCNDSKIYQNTSNTTKVDKKLLLQQEELTDKDSKIYQNTSKTTKVGKQLLLQQEERTDNNPVNSLPSDSTNKSATTRTDAVISFVEEHENCPHVKFTSPQCSSSHENSSSNDTITDFERNAKLSADRKTYSKATKSTICRETGELRIQQEETTSPVGQRNIQERSSLMSPSMNSKNDSTWINYNSSSGTLLSATEYSTSSAHQSEDESFPIQSISPNSNHSVADPNCSIGNKPDIFKNDETSERSQRDTQKRSFQTGSQTPNKGNEDVAHCSSSIGKKPFLQNDGSLQEHQTNQEHPPYQRRFPESSGNNNESMAVQPNETNGNKDVMNQFASSVDSTVVSTSHSQRRAISGKGGEIEVAVIKPSKKSINTTVKQWPRIENVQSNLGTKTADKHICGNTRVHKVDPKAANDERRIEVILNENAKSMSPQHIDSVMECPVQCDEPNQSV